MKRLATILAAVIMSAATMAKKPLSYVDSLDAMILAVGYVESLNNPNAIGDNGGAIGFLQITDIMVKEANRLAGIELFTMDDVADSMTSVCLFTHVFSMRLNGELDPEKVARLWNPRADSRYRKDIKDRYYYYLHVFEMYGK